MDEAKPPSSASSHHRTLTLRPHDPPVARVHRGKPLARSSVPRRTVIPNPFWGGALFPGVVFGVMYAWPALERFCHGPGGDRAGRGGAGLAYYRLEIFYVGQIHFWRVGIWLFPDHHLLHHPQRHSGAAAQRLLPDA
jgi:hypothetical protein